MTPTMAAKRIHKEKDKLVWLTFQYPKSLDDQVNKFAARKFENNRSQAARYLVRLGLQSDAEGLELTT